MRATTAFKRMLRLPGASVTDISFGAERVIVTVGLRRRRTVCSSCGQVGGSIHGRRVKRWRHLDLGASRCVIECELRRAWCPDCGARFEAVPWARGGSRLDGGRGRDSASFRSLPTPLSLDLRMESVSASDRQDVLSSVEDVDAGEPGAVIKGTNGPNTLSAAFGSVLIGLAGNDRLSDRTVEHGLPSTLDGGPGDDTLFPHDRRDRLRCGGVTTSSRSLPPSYPRRTRWSARTASG